MKTEITFCNRAYAKRWYKNLQRQNPAHFEILNAIIEEIEDKYGGGIVKSDIYLRKPEVARKIIDLNFNIIPSSGQMLSRNGHGIRHAKYAPSKSIAVVWERIGDTIYVTFDDHAPVAYHRAIEHLRQIRLGGPAFPKHARTTGWFLKTLRQFRRNRHQRRFKGFDPKRRFFD